MDMGDELEWSERDTIVLFKQWSIGTDENRHNHLSG
jgi:hypothetical protein